MIHMMELGEVNEPGAIGAEPAVRGGGVPVRGHSLCSHGRCQGSTNEGTNEPNLRASQNSYRETCEITLSKRRIAKARRLGSH